MTFPDVQSATDYVKSKLQDFYNQSTVLKNRLLQIGQLIQQAKRDNDQEALGRLIIAQSQAKDLMNEQNDLEQQLQPFAQYFGVQTYNLGLLPVVLTVAAVAVATMLYLHFEKIQQQGQALDLIAKGMLKPDEAQAILNPGILSTFFGGGISSYLLYALIGGGLYLYLTARR